MYVQQIGGELLMEEVKIIILGEPGVGKTSLIDRFIHGQSARPESYGRNSHYDPDVKVKETVTSNGTPVKAYLHDSPRREQSFDSHNLAPNFYRNADAVMLVYSVDDNSTLEALQDIWVTEYAYYQEIETTSWIIVGNKNDLPLEIDRKSIESLNRRLLETATSFFVSAKTGNNVKEVFEVAIKRAHERRKLKEGRVSLGTDGIQSEQTKKCSC